MSQQIYQFGKIQFNFQEFIKLTKHKKGYRRNLLNEMQ